MMDKNYEFQMAIASKKKRKRFTKICYMINDLCCSPFEDVEFPRPDGPGGDILPGVDNDPELTSSPVASLHGKLR